VPIFVILSEAKDLIAACQGHETFRFAQDDNVGKWLGARTNIAVIPSEARDL
jgi:hypothetical protein